MNAPMDAIPPVEDAPPPYTTVLFDCDSTLSFIEGVEQVAGARGPEIAELTRRAMGGELRLEEVYGARLELLRPTRGALEEVGREYVRTAVPHARELVAALRSLGKTVGIVSGGLLPAVAVLADWLGIDPDHAHAVELRFDAEGAYAGFDDRHPLARNGGKPAWIAERYGSAGPVALVGDGATDLEAARVCARFVAFGGVEDRPAVAAAARVHYTRPDLAGLAPLLLSDDELARLGEDPAHRTLMAAAAALS